MTQDTNISGTRIWLAGSIPDDAPAERAEAVRQFVRTLALTCFRDGAVLVHGFHPSLTPLLLIAAQEFRAATGRKAPLTLAVSTFFRDSKGGYGGIGVPQLQAECELVQVPRAASRERSLEDLRSAIALQSDTVIALGGRWWKEDRASAGVPAEFLLAVNRGIPVFLAGAFGGATAGYLEQRPEILRNLRNGWDLAGNQAAAAMSDPEAAVRHILDQIGRLPLGRREAAGGQPFRVLALDGGGIRGAFTAAVLAQWEEMSGLRVAGHFDLIAGTSTGGILAIALSLGLGADEILHFYKQHGPEIFPNTGVLAPLKHKIAAKYDAAVLEKKLSAVYDRSGQIAYLRDCRRRLLITSYDLTGNSLRLYRTSHHPSVKGHDDLRVAVIARATSAAPTFFKPAIVDDLIAVQEAVDGGVWANCPALAAYGEAVGVLGIPPERVEILSVGTAGMPEFVKNPQLEGLAGWAFEAAPLFMNSQMEATLWYLERILGSRFLRVNDDQPRIEEMDNARDLEYLIARGAKVGEEFAGKVMKRFLNGVRADDWRNVAAPSDAASAPKL